MSFSTENVGRLGISRFSCTTQFPPDSFELQSELQCSLVLQGAFVVGITETDLNQGQVDPGANCFLGCSHGDGIVSRSSEEKNRATARLTAKALQMWRKGEDFGC